MPKTMHLCEIGNISISKNRKSIEKAKHCTRRTGETPVAPNVDLKNADSADITIGYGRDAIALRSGDKPNIIFILADDLGYGDLGCYGQKKIMTPHLDRMAAEGMRFTQFYAGSTVCAPSRCVLMTGRDTGHCLIRGNARVPLRPQDVTVAEVLQGAGYATGLVGKWGLGEPGTSGVPTKQGFDKSDVAARHPNVAAKMEGLMKSAHTDSPDWPIAAGGNGS